MRGVHCAWVGRGRLRAFSSLHVPARFWIVGPLWLAGCAKSQVTSIQSFATKPFAHCGLHALPKEHNRNKQCSSVYSRARDVQESHIQQRTGHINMADCGWAVY